MARINEFSKLADAASPAVIDLLDAFTYRLHKFSGEGDAWIRTTLLDEPVAAVDRLVRELKRRKLESLGWRISDGGPVTGWEPTPNGQEVCHVVYTEYRTGKTIADYWIHSFNDEPEWPCEYQTGDWLHDDKATGYEWREFLDGPGCR